MLGHLRFEILILDVTIAFSRVPKALDAYIDIAAFALAKSISRNYHHFQRKFYHIFH